MKITREKIQSWISKMNIPQPRKFNPEMDPETIEKLKARLYEDLHEFRIQLQDYWIDGRPKTHTQSETTQKFLFKVLSLLDNVWNEMSRYGDSEQGEL